MTNNILEKAYYYADLGDDSSALSVILDEFEKLLALKLPTIASQFSKSVDLDKIKLAKYCKRFMDLRNKTE